VRSDNASAATRLIESVGAVISGDTLVDFGRGLEINAWLREDVTREEVADGLRPLLALPVQLVLPTHDAPTDRAALERALARRLTCIASSM
jgi:hypothetical protein